MATTEPIRIKTISEFHALRGLPPPEHPLISVVDYSKMKTSYADDAPGLLFDFYLISIKRGIEGKMRYGQQSYDFDEGVMFFMAFLCFILTILTPSHPLFALHTWHFHSISLVDRRDSSCQARFAL